MKKIFKYSVVAVIVLFAVIIIGLFTASNSEKFVGGIAFLFGLGLIVLIGAAIIALLAKLARSSPTLGPTGVTAPTAPKSWWEKVAENPVGKNLMTTGILTVIYVIGFWLLYGPLASWLRSRFGFSNIQSWSLVTLLGLGFIFPSVWLLYSAANIPGDPKNVKRGMRLIAFAVLLVLAYIKWSGPSELFNPDDGKAKFWIDKTTGEMVYDPSADSSKTRYSSKTGHRLKLGEPEDVKLAASQQSGSNPITSLFMSPPPDTRATSIVSLGEWSEDDFLDPPPYNGLIVYRIPAGDYWSQAISLPKGRVYSFDVRAKTQEKHFSPGKETWSQPRNVGPGYRFDISGSSAISFQARADRDVFIDASWR